mmetsp:Transcript_34777/g.95913  ORF Transcript_34777/g.95913 Transcript_34777/m.95913 type:complete len:214 (-) Transcript_34777:1107-1748(-)
MGGLLGGEGHAAQRDGLGVLATRRDEFDQPLGTLDRAIMGWTEGGATILPHLAKNALGLLGLAREAKEGCEIIHGIQRMRVADAKLRAPTSTRSAVQLERLVAAARVVKVDCQVVHGSECIQAIWAHPRLESCQNVTQEITSLRRRVALLLELQRQLRGHGQGLHAVPPIGLLRELELRARMLDPPRRLHPTVPGLRGRVRRPLSGPGRGSAR